jgi:CDP-6-deoxy-D-xylo-4-hexulose-3-dehydrase
MPEPIYPLASSTWGQEEINAINEVISSDMYTMGSKVKEFEMEYAKHFGHGHAVMCNSGSSANLLMLALLKLKYKLTGDIIVPAVGWSTSYFPVNQNGFKLNFVDVDPTTFNIDTTKIESAITPNTCAIMAINLLGNPCDYDAIYKIADKHNLFVIEDNCESMGAKYDGKYTGSHGIIGTQSFFFSHHLQTMEGGMVTVDNSEDADWLRSLRAHGWCRDLSDSNPLFQKTGGWKDNFTFVTPGYTVRPLEMSGAIGLEQLKKWDEILSARLKNKEHFFKLFGDQKYFKLQKTQGESSWFSFGCICTGELRGRRDELVTALTEAGIQSRPLASGNWLRQPVMNMLDCITNGDYTGADEIEDEGFFVGNGMKDVSEGIDAMYEVVKKLTS